MLIIQNSDLCFKQVLGISIQFYHVDTNTRPNIVVTVERASCIDLGAYLIFFAGMAERLKVLLVLLILATLSLAKPTTFTNYVR